MSRDDDYDQDDYSRSGSSGHSDARHDYGKTSDFNTALISEDGRFLGLKISPDMASQLRTFSAGFLDWARKKAEKVGIPMAEKFAKNVLHASEHDAMHFGTKAGNVIGYGVILSNQIADVWQNLYSSTQRLNDLRIAVHPLAKASGSRKSTAPLSGNNEVVANARAKINGIFRQRMMHTLTSAIAITPALYSKITEQAAVNRERAEELEWKLAETDPEARKRLIDKELKTSGLSGETGASAEVLEAVIEGQRKKYEEKFTAFKKANEPEIKKKIKETINEITLENYYSKTDSLKRLGINTDRLNDDIRWATRNSGTKESKSPADILREWKNNIDRKEMSHLVEETLKGKFVDRHGAFDGEWDRYRHHDRYSRNRDSSPTIKEQWEQKFQKREEARIKAKEEERAARNSHSKAENGFDFGTMAAGLGTGILSEFATKTLGGKAIEEYKKPIALDRILHLRRSLEDVQGEPPETIHPAAGSNDQDMGYVRYVHQVFQQHQKDCNRPEIGERFIENFEKNRWEDAAIMQAPDSELNPYEFAIKTIAQRIKTGRMDAIALIELVGDKQRKIVHSDGRSFGPSRTQDDDAAKKAIAALIDEKTATLHAGQKHTDEEVNEKLGNFIFSVQDMKQALVAKDMDPQQRAFIFTLFSDVVGSDEKLCGKLGISNEHCQQLRKESKEQFAAMLDSVVGVMADMIENEPEKLEKHLKLTDKQKELILAVAGRSKEQGKLASDVVENARERETIEAVVADGVMALGKAPAEQGEDGKPQNFWQKIVAATRKPKQPKEASDGQGEERENPKRKSRSSRKPREDMDDSFNPDKMDSDDFPGQDGGERPSHTGRLGGRKERGFSPIERLSDKPKHDESGILGV